MASSVFNRLKKTRLFRIINEPADGMDLWKFNRKVTRGITGVFVAAVFTYIWVFHTVAEKNKKRLKERTQGKNAVIRLQGDKKMSQEEFQRLVEKNSIELKNFKPV